MPFYTPIVTLLAVAFYFFLAIRVAASRGQFKVNLPARRTPREACVAARRAVSAAQVGMAHLDKARRNEGLPPLSFGTALHLGEMLWGNIGAADRLDFTAIGSAVNLVSRLEGLCKPLGKTVLVSGALAAESGLPLIPLGTHALRGIVSPCAVFTVPEQE
jgi:adenylate cyclase